ncbi:hypothetical protein H6F88_16610 [Oculatella sp. FACHB-28]|uniref:hypothetical protein n=1 Tax=Oculatella sp. FACHB-28 TaxID=2692845 RepID=UPI001687F005|nr:hypothetical protein [Oculatella sp. FACHB-28]MBD2057621.1 hypothetical protein [Oculatella sp. FACHB-28]
MFAAIALRVCVSKQKDSLVKAKVRINNTTESTAKLKDQHVITLKQKKPTDHLLQYQLLGYCRTNLIGRRGDRTKKI